MKNNAPALHSSKNLKLPPKFNRNIVKLFIMPVIARINVRTMPMTGAVVFGSNGPNAFTMSVIVKKKVIRIISAMIVLETVMFPSNLNRIFVMPCKFSGISCSFSKKPSKLFTLSFKSETLPPKSVVFPVWAVTRGRSKSKQINNVIFFMFLFILGII